MGISIKTTTDPEDAALFIATSVIDKLKLGKHVLLFMTGGSSVAVGVKVAKFLRENTDEKLIGNLAITLTDERYGVVGHSDSNWQQLIDRGFDLPKAKLIPVLIGADKKITTQKFNEELNEEFMREGYKIGMFGIGADGHTAGVLPNSDAISSSDFAFSYDTPTFSRITITPKAIEKLDEAVVWVQGEDKWPILKDLEKDIDIKKQPAQILKKVPLLKIFTNYKKE
jgi:6-phosphogluconolactonase/glucosamine-6-phosphate isomerase/deaminase